VLGGALLKKFKQNLWLERSGGYNRCWCSARVLVEYSTSSIDSTKHNCLMEYFMHCFYFEKYSEGRKQIKFLNCCLKNVEVAGLKA
jgi:hypothetical protein